MGPDERSCPVCAETIKRQATVCRFCGAKADLIGHWRPSKQQNSFQSCMSLLGYIVLGIMVLYMIGRGAG
jgi:hypothetical protein